jgi:hypothetical protein
VVARQIVLGGFVPPDTVHIGWSGSLSAVLVDGRGRPLAGGGSASFAVSGTTVLRLVSVGTQQQLRAIAAGRDSLVVTMGGVRLARPLTVAPNAVSMQGTSFTQLALGSLHGCGLTSAGVAQCWGSNILGQLGRGLPTGSTSQGHAAAPVSGGLTFTAIAAGASTSCGVTTQKRAYCWGTGGVPNATNVPTLVLADRDVESVAVGDEGRVCASTKSDGLWCWRTSTLAGPAIAPYQFANVPPLKSMELGQYEFGCGLTAAGRTWCWGAQAAEQTSAPAFTQVARGEFADCGLATDGTVSCWGRNDAGEIGRDVPIGSTSYGIAPIQSSQRFTAIGGGRRTMCGLATDGVISCWGSHPFFPDAKMTTPARLFGDAVFRGLVMSGSAICGRLEGGDLRCIAWKVELDA